jgi:uncharacterized Ntn-hydrolase superfamily protein
MLELNTFSIAARCERTGMLGVAVSTAVPGVGGICPFVAPGVGAVSTQSWVNPYLGIDGVALMAQGLGAKAALKKLDRGRSRPRCAAVGIVDKGGQSAAYTGKSCVPWAGHIIGKNFAVQGNMLVGEPTVKAMAEAFQRTPEISLPERLIVVLEAGQSAGGDKRGRQSAAVKIYYKEEFPYLDLRVDEHRHPSPNCAGSSRSRATSCFLRRRHAQPQESSAICRRAPPRCCSSRPSRRRGPRRATAELTRQIPRPPILPVPSLYHMLSRCRSSRPESRAQASLGPSPCRNRARSCHCIQRAIF